MRHTSEIPPVRVKETEFAETVQDELFSARASSLFGRGRICLGQKKKISQVFAGQAVGIKQVHDDIWLVSFMDYDLGYFDLETRVLEPLGNPFGPKVLPTS